MGFFSKEAGQKRRAWLDDKSQGIGETLQYYLGPGVPVENFATIGDALNPVSDIGRAGQSAQQVARGDMGQVIPMVTDMASVLAPVGAAKYAGGNATNAVVDSLLGIGQPTRKAATKAGKDFIADESGSVPLGKILEDKPKIRAYHGSPHSFDKFQMDRIGTGEGAQAYGHGLYFAENEGVARNYRDQLTGGNTSAARRTLESAGGDVDRAITETQQKLDRLKERAAAGDFGGDTRMMAAQTQIQNDKISQLKKYKETGAFDSGSMYEVEINANPDDFLDWDAPLSAQPEGVRHLANDNKDNLANRGYFVRDESPASELVRSMRPEEMTGNSEAYGIPGIKYKDAGSRGIDGADGTRNYVVFDENLINIVRKYGIAGAAAMLGMSASDVQAAMGQGQQNDTPLREYLK